MAQQNHTTSFTFQAARNKLAAAAMQTHSAEHLRQTLTEAGVAVDATATHRSLAHKFAHHLLPGTGRDACVPATMCGSYSNVT